MSKPAVGKELVTRCSKCKLDLAHMIVVMKDEETPLKVECKTCGSIHSYKAAKTAKKKATIKTRTPRKSAAEKITIIWEAGMKKFKGEKAKYSIKTKFEAGQVIIHPTFGEGVVERAIDADKVEVTFETEVKVLRHNK